jgi:uncharacterized protein (TIGR03000 family)
MYSVVLLVAMSSGTQTPDHGMKGGCCGGYSCCGSYSCCGYSSCHGGGGLFRHGRRHGCCGGGYGGCCGGYVSYGCCGSYGGCYGGYSGCCGASYSGCCGGGWGGGYSGCCGASYGCGSMAPAPVYGMSPVYGSGSYSTPVYSSPVIGPTTAAPVNSATVVVNLPAEAKLTFGTQATTSTSARRVFETPELTPGKVYEYTLTAEVVRQGKPVSWTEKVNVEAGRSTEVTMTVPASSGVASR